MKIKYKITISIFLISLLILASSIYANYVFNYKDKLNEQRKNLTQNAYHTAFDIEDGLLDNLSNVLSMSCSPIVTNYLLQSNAKFKTINNREKYISNLNKKWMNADGEKNSFVSKYLQNKLSLYLKKEQKILPNRYGELFITNKYGAMIATTAKLTTLAHAQKYWWEESYNKGKGKIFFDDRGFDMSANSYVMGIVIPIRYKNKIIGILKANIKIMDILSDTVKYYKIRNQGSLKIVRTKGLVVYEENLPPLSTTINPKILNALKHKENGCTIVADYQREKFISYAPVLLKFKDKEISFGGKKQSIDHQKGNSNEIWHTVIIYDKEFALKEFESNNKLILFIGLILSIFSAISAFILAKWISKPVEALQLAHKKIKEQDEVILVQSRQAAMGEMISMIAHQWRQPLSVISMSANNVIADIELEDLNEKSLKTSMFTINEQIKELSNTIDDFRNFFRLDKDTEILYIEDILKNALNIINASFIYNNIEVITNIDTKIEIQTYKRELMHVVLNILQNAKDVLLENKITNKQIHISTYNHLDTITIEICDNGGGIEEKLLDKIFEPYFSTKSKKNGTGLGLYMSKTIIENHLFGLLNVSNKNGGACFEIIVPKRIERVVNSDINSAL